MISQLSQETVTEYASDAQTIQEPQGADYSRGVQVGKTVPAKWWNWLFNAVTKRASQSKTDAQNMLNELKNVVTDAGLTPDASDSTQLAQAVVETTDRRITNYINRKKWFYEKWGKVSQSQMFTQSSGASNDGRWADYSSEIGSVYLYYTSYYNDTTLRDCKCCVDGVHWHTIPVTSYLVNVKQYPSIALLKIRDVYILLISYQNNITDVREYSYAMLYSKDLDNWTWSTALSTGGSAIVLGMGVFTINDTLYIFSERKGLFYTQDGINFTQQSIANTYRSYQRLKVLDSVEAFSGGYLVGNSIFNPSTNSFTVMVEGSYVAPLQDSILMQNGTAILYATSGSNDVYYTCRAGETPVQHTTTGFTGIWSISSDRKVICKIKIDSSTNEKTLIFSLDGINITSPHVFNSYYDTSVACVYLNGWYYCINKRTQDFQTWEDIPNLDITLMYKYVINTGFSNILVVYDRQNRIGYVTFDDCAHWAPITFDPIAASDGEHTVKQITYMTKNSMFNSRGMDYSMYIIRLDIWAGSTYTTECYVAMYAISETVNHVEGYTLYLR